MGRLHLFEFNDQPWLPNALRVLVTDFLQTLIARFGIYQQVVPLLRRLLDKVRPRRVIDLCSGGGGPVLSILGALGKGDDKVSVVLTDLYPNEAAFSRAAEAHRGVVSFESQPVDATNVPAHLEGVRTIFTAFHHFRPDRARAILRNAAANRHPIAIVEFTGRDALLPLRVLFAPLLVLLLTPLVRPFSWSRLFLTYLLPIAPLLVLWDGIVSDLRTYSPKELERLVKEIPTESYGWSIGRHRGPVARVTYLLGEPAEPQRQIDAP